MKIKNIAVFCSSSDALEEIYYKETNLLGELIAEKGINLVWGGASVGLMKTIADAVKSKGGKVIGVLPKILQERGIDYKQADKMIIVNDLRERKALMDKNTNAFIILPGGFGTLEEALEIITLKQIKVHNRPIVFLNIDNFFKPLMGYFEFLFNKKFINPKSKNFYYFAQSPKEAIEYILNYKPEEIPDKWIKKVAETYN